MAGKLAGSGGDDASIEQKADINVTPFVDVMLVLLIIFMVAAPMATIAVKLDLPYAVAEQKQNPPKPVYISIQKDGSLHLGDNPTNLTNLGDDLLQLLKGKHFPTKERIFIRADKATIYGDFMGVMNRLQEYHFYSVALIGLDPRSGHPQLLKQ
jgi:biopolymer transport protein ExbD